MRIFTPVLFIGALFCSPAFAHDAGEFFVRLGVAQVSPDASSDMVLGGGVDVDDSTGLGISGTWFMGSHLGVEVLGALPFEHDIVGSGALAGLDIGSTKHLPPTVSLQYYPLSDGDFQLYLGIGVNYTTFFSTETTDALDTALGGNSDLSLDDSTGIAFQLGADWKLGNNFYLNAAIWKIDIETTADISVDGADIASVDVTIDPLVAMLGIGFAF